jgi:hypothetical protein
VISKPIKNNVSNYGINLKKIIQQSSITIVPMFLAGEFLHNIEAVFCWVQFPHNIEAAFLLGSRGFLWVQIMGSQNVMGSGYGSNISGKKTLGVFDASFAPFAFTPLFAKNSGFTSYWLSWTTFCHFSDTYVRSNVQD